MRIAFLLLLIVHGSIHLFGFVKAFGLAVVKELTLPITKTYGMLWLTAFICFAIVSVMLLSGAVIGG